jgi:hypothetical protein
VPAAAPAAVAAPEGGQATAGSSIAILPFASAGASETEVSAAADRLHEELLRIGGAPLADPGVVAAAFARRKAQPDGCVSQECAAGVARSVGAPRFVTGKITRFDETHWLVAAQLMEGDAPKPVRAASLQYTGTFFDFVREGIPFLAARIAGTRPRERRGLATRLKETLYFDARSGAQAGTEAASAGTAVRRQGFGLFTGYAAHGGTIHPKAGGSVSYSGGGIPSLGVDYQIEIKPDITLSPYFVDGGAGVSGNISTVYDRVAAGELGMEVRTWWDTVYIGARAALYAIIFTDTTDKKNDPFTLGGLSLGLSGGVEGANGMFLGGAVDYASFSNSKKVLVRPDTVSPRVALDGTGSGYSLWINVGYRWK